MNKIGSTPANGEDWRSPSCLGRKGEGKGKGKLHTVENIGAQSQRRGMRFQRRNGFDVVAAKQGGEAW